jgi:hypothetical protein
VGNLKIAQDRADEPMAAQFTVPNVFVSQVQRLYCVMHTHNVLKSSFKQDLVADPVTPTFSALSHSSGGIFLEE